MAEKVVGKLLTMSIYRYRYILFVFPLTTVLEPVKLSFVLDLDMLVRTAIVNN